MDPVQIVITKAPDGYDVIIMSATTTLLRKTYSNREFALAVIADYMLTLVRQ